MNAPSVFRIIIGVGGVIGSLIIGKTLITGAKKMSISRATYTTLDNTLNQQEKELNEKRRIREDLLKD